MPYCPGAPGCRNPNVIHGRYSDADAIAYSYRTRLLEHGAILVDRAALRELTASPLVIDIYLWPALQQRIWVPCPRVLSLVISAVVRLRRTRGIAAPPKHPLTDEKLASIAARSCSFERVGHYVASLLTLGSISSVASSMRGST